MGRILRSPSNGFAVEVQNGCNAVNVTILLWAAIATYPARLDHEGSRTPRVAPSPSTPSTCSA